MPFALHKTKPIQQPTGTKKDLSITMTSRSPKTSHASIYSHCCSELVSGSFYKHTTQQGPRDSQQISLHHSQMLGQKILVAGHQLLVQEVSESHHPAPDHGNSKPAVIRALCGCEVTRVGHRIYPHII